MSKVFSVYNLPICTLCKVIWALFVHIPSVLLVFIRIIGIEINMYDANNFKMVYKCIVYIFKTIGTYFIFLLRMN